MSEQSIDGGIHRHETRILSTTGCADLVEDGSDDPLSDLAAPLTNGFVRLAEVGRRPPERTGPVGGSAWCHPGAVGYHRVVAWPTEWNSSPTHPSLSPPSRGSWPSAC